MYSLCLNDCYGLSENPHSFVMDLFVLTEYIELKLPTKRFASTIDSYIG